MKRVLINVEERELRIAILEGDQLSELYIESLDNKTVLNNIYKGRTEGVLPGLNAAFVNIGLDRNAFLHFDDVRPDLLLELQSARRAPSEPTAQAVPEEAPPPEVTASYVPTPEELEVITTLEQNGTGSAEEIAPPLTVPSGSSKKKRRRRRGRRGGQRNRDQQWQAREGAPMSSVTVGESSSEGNAEGAQDIVPAPVETVFASPSDGASSTPVSAPESVTGSATVSPQPFPSQQQSSSQHRKDRRRSKHQKQRSEAKHSRFTPPPPDALRGTRAASNPYDVFTPFRPAQKQKKDKRRKKTSGVKTLDHLLGPTTLPPDVPLDKDSQEDFFGPARPSADYSDEPMEERVGASANSQVEDEGYLDDGIGNRVEPPTRNAQTSKKKSSSGRRRSIRRKGPAQYAVRRAKAKKQDGEEEPASESPKAAGGQEEPPSPKKRSSRKKKTESSVPSEEAASLRENSLSQPGESGASRSRRKGSTKKTTLETGEKEMTATSGAAVNESIANATPAPDESKQVSSSASPETSTTTEKKKTKARRKKEITEESVSLPVAEEGVSTEEKPPEKRERKRASRKKVKQEPEPTSAAPSAEAAAEIVTVSPVADTIGTAAAASDEVVSEALPEAGESPVEEVPPAQASVAPKEEVSPTLPLEETPSAAAPVGAERAEPRLESQVVLAQEPSAQMAQGEVEPPAETSPQPARQEQPQQTREEDHQRFARHRIPLVHEVLKKGDEIIVQVTKEEIGGKGARISTYISLPGRYLVLLPYGNNEGGVSRRVEDYEERRRLKKLQRKIRHELGIQNMGLIIRTAGMERNEQELKKDAEFLLQQWKQIEQRAASVSAPALLYDDSDILYRLCRDVFDEEIEEIIIDSPTHAEKLKSILRSMIPSLVDRVHLYENPRNIFVEYKVDEKIRKAGRRKVWLKSGGYIIIDEAEALTAIDVNTGKFVGKDNQEQMIFKTNIEAAHVIARELKLRDIGGLIVIDFIDMRDHRNREALLNEFRNLLRKDHAKTSVSNISEFGLVEMTRKRVRQSLRKTIFTDCPYCKGSGVVLSPQQIWIELKNDLISTLEGKYPKPDLVVTLNPEMKKFIDDYCKEIIGRLEQRYQVRIQIEASPELHIEEWKKEERPRSGDALGVLIEGLKETCG
jgi:Rne/Rng family ribonuclease